MRTIHLAWAKELVRVKGAGWDGNPETYSGQTQLFEPKHHRILAKLVGRIRTHWREQSANHNTSNQEDYGYAMVIQLLKEELVAILETDCYDVETMLVVAEDQDRTLLPDHDWEDEIESGSSEAIEFFDREKFEAQVSMAEAQADR